MADFTARARKLMGDSLCGTPHLENEHHKYWMRIIATALEAAYREGKVVGPERFDMPKWYAEGYAKGIEDAAKVCLERANLLRAHPRSKPACITTALKCEMEIKALAKKETTT